MLRNFTKMMCVALVSVLCIGTLNAQIDQSSRVKSIEGKPSFTLDVQSSKVITNQPTSPTRAGNVKVTLKAGDVWGDGSGYQLLLDANADFIETGSWASSGDVPASTYALFEYKIPENADGACNTTNIVINNSITIEIPAGTYDYLVTNPTPGDKVYFATDGLGDNFVFEAGKKYTFSVVLNGQNDKTNLTIEDDGEPCPSIKNLAYTQEGTDVTITWDAPEGDAPTSYKVYDGTKEVVTLTDVLTYTFTNLSAGTHALGVAAIYDGEECLPKTVSKEVVIKTCASVSNVTVTYAEECAAATISWNAPAKNRASEMIWDNTDIQVESSGLVSMRWALADADVSLADDFEIDDNWNIEKIYTAGFNAVANQSDPQYRPDKMAVMFFTDNSGKPGEEIYAEKSLDFVFQDNTYIISLPEPFAIESGKYWISIMGVFNSQIPTNDPEFLANNMYIYYGPVKNGSNMMLRDLANFFDIGTDWKDGSSLTGGKGNSMYFAIEGSLGAPSIPVYNVYRDGVKIATEIEATTFTDETFDIHAAHEWAVTVACSNGGEGNWVRVNKEACDPVGIANPLEESLRIFPNPASATVSITGSDVQKVEIYNTVGQLVEVRNSNVQSIDVSSYNVGLYFFKVYDSKNNVVTKRVMVAR